MKIPEDAEFIPGIKLRDKATDGLPPELKLWGSIGGGAEGLWLAETALGERLTARQWNARFRQWRDGTPPAPTPRPGAPETYLSPEERDRLEAMILDVAPTFKERDHLRCAAAGVLSGVAANRRQACEQAIRLHGDVFYGEVQHDLGCTRRFHSAVGKLVRRFHAPD